jgi:hypothetical protein
MKFIFHEHLWVQSFSNEFNKLLNSITNAITSSSANPTPSTPHTTKFWARREPKTNSQESQEMPTFKNYPWTALLTSGRLLFNPFIVGLIKINNSKFKKKFKSARTYYVFGWIRFKAPSIACKAKLGSKLQVLLVRVCRALIHRAKMTSC